MNVSSVHGSVRAFLRIVPAAVLSTVLLTGCGNEEGNPGSMSNPSANLPEAPSQLAAGADYTENLSGSVNLQMVFVEGGTFQMGCAGSGCGENESPVQNVTLSDFYIGRYEVTQAQWHAVMGGSAPSAGNANRPVASIDWYDVHEFICKLNSMAGITGKIYRLPTESEWEFAARGGNNSNNTRFSGSGNADDVAWHSGNLPAGGWGFGASQPVGGKDANELGIHDMSGNVREWVYDSWGNYTASDKTDPTGSPQLHTQKIRRGGSFLVASSFSTVTGRQIRSIEGADSDLGLRLAISPAQNTIPAGMVNPCEIIRPPLLHGNGTLRDGRLTTRDDEVWISDGFGAASILILRENGAAVRASRFGNFTQIQAAGEWATSNDFSLYIVDNSNNRTKLIYYVLSTSDMTLMPDNGMPGRWLRRPASEISWIGTVSVPAITSPRPPEQLVPAGAAVDMANPPADQQDPRLIVAQSLGSGDVWLQDNVAGGFGGTHRYRFDYTPDTARFVVWDAPPGMGTSVTIAAGKWFTIDNTFLRVVGSNGRHYDYLYTVSTDGDTHYHISFQGYERGDSRMFNRAPVSESANWQWMEPTMFPYATSSNGGSTFVPPESGSTSIREIERVVRL